MNTCACVQFFENIIHKQQCAPQKQQVAKRRSCTKKKVMECTAGADPTFLSRPGSGE